MGYCWLLLSFWNPGSFRFPIQWRQEPGFFSRGAWGREGGARMSAAWWQWVLTWNFGSTSWQSPVQKKVSGFHGLEHVNAIKPIILKPIECRSSLWAPVDIMQPWNLPHGAASVRSDIPYCITLSLGWLCSFYGAREGTREGERRRACFLEISAFAQIKRHLLPVSRVLSILPEEWFAIEVALLFPGFVSRKDQSNSANRIVLIAQYKYASLPTKTYFRSSRLSTQRSDDRKHVYFRRLEISQQIQVEGVFLSLPFPLVVNGSRVGLFSQAKPKAVVKLIYNHLDFALGDFLPKNAPPLARMRLYVKILKQSGHFEASKDAMNDHR